MRLWSLHPKYLDAKGLVALWREALLAKHVLEGKTKGYTNHPQLNRFKKSTSPIAAIHQYLAEIYHEACNRNYIFDKTRINFDHDPILIPVTTGQLQFEVKHLIKKLQSRDQLKYDEFFELISFDPHPLFHIVTGEIEEWEIIKK